MTTYFKIAPLASDVLLSLPHSLLSLLCVLKVLITRTYTYALTHAMRIRKLHAVLNDTPDMYFIVRTK